MRSIKKDSIKYASCCTPATLPLPSSELGAPDTEDQESKFDRKINVSKPWMILVRIVFFGLF
jgi:hypothetical protein